VAGVDPGIIHPFAVVSGEEALLVSGRALRAECHLHLADTKARSRRMCPKAPSRGQGGSRRWRKLRRAQRRAEARHRRRIHDAHHVAAKAVVAWAIDHKVGTLRVGDPEGICNREVGRRQNLRLRNWRRTHLIRALKDKAELAGIALVEVDERGSSSTCPRCRRRVPKRRGRAFCCSNYGFRGHRDLVGAANIAATGGGTMTCGTNPQIEHRRVGTPPTRRDRQRHRHDERRSCLAHGRRGCQARSRSPKGAERRARPSAIRAHAGSPAIGEEPPTALHPSARGRRLKVRALAASRGLNSVRGILEGSTGTAATPGSPPWRHLLPLVAPPPKPPGRSPLADCTEDWDTFLS
jgi:putative transposase